MWITSLPQIRRKNFEVFYYTHHLYIVFLVAFLFHAGDRHFYWVLPGMFLFGLDKILRIVQSRSESCILSANLFSCKAIELVLPKDPSKKINFSKYFKHIKKRSLTLVNYFGILQCLTMHHQVLYS